MRAFGWLEVWQKTPMNLGLSRDELDPAYEEAMLRLKSAVNAERQVMAG